METKTSKILSIITAGVILIAFITLNFSCLENNINDQYRDELGKYNNTTIDNISDIDSVSLWIKENEIIFTDYYSQIDTIISEKIIKREISYYCSENDSVSVKWKINGIIQNDTVSSKKWKGLIGKWLVTNTANLNIDGITENVQVEAIVQFSNKIIRRFKTIPKVTIINDISDAFGFTFGMKRALMNFELDDKSPQFAFNYAFGEPVLFQILEFSDGKLLRIYHISDVLLYPNNEASMYLSKRCQIPESITLSNDTILNPQEWEKGNLKIKAFNTAINNIIPTVNIDSKKRFCLTIEKSIKNE